MHVAISEFVASLTFPWQLLLPKTDFYFPVAGYSFSKITYIIRFKSYNTVFSDIGCLNMQCF